MCSYKEQEKVAVNSAFFYDAAVGLEILIHLKEVRMKVAYSRSILK